MTDVLWPNLRSAPLCRPACWVSWFLVTCACQSSEDIVAASYGDYDPGHPPAVLALSGALDAHNPTAFRADERYWLYRSGPGLPAKSSADLHLWQDETQVFSEPPAWIADLVPDCTDLWSPSVAFFGGVYHLYYAASSFGSNRSCIGHATAASVGTGSQFVDQGHVICSNVTDVAEDFNAIDPSLLLDSDGVPWLVFGSFDSGIKLLALDANGARRGDALVAVAARTSDNPAIQAPFIMKWREHYYLFVSFDACCRGSNSDYNLRVGRSTALLGPYLDRDGVAMLSGGGTLLLAGDTRWRGPGSNMVLADGSKRYNVYHAYDADANGRATLRIAELAFDNEGWPVSGGP